jgi:DNA-binding NarL/FixJ family response regulator
MESKSRELQATHAGALGETDPSGGELRPSLILLVDDHALFRRGLKALIESEPGWMVCAEAASHHEALALIPGSNLDLVITDLSLQDSDGLDLIKEIKRLYPDLPVLALSMHDETIHAERALRAGACGYVSKQEIDDTVLCAIRSLLAGGTHASEALYRHLSRKFMAGGKLGKDPGLELLSNRELEVFRLIGGGRSTREIALSLGLSVKTIEAHREHLKAKLNLSSGAALGRCAILWLETGRLGKE